MVLINDLVMSFVRFVMPNIAMLYEQTNGAGRRYPFLSQEHTIWLLDNIYNQGKGDPKIFGALILFAPLSTGLLDFLGDHDLFCEVFIASCFDTGFIENLCAPQPPSTRTFLKKLSRIVNPGAPDSSPSKWLILHSRYSADDVTYTSIVDKCVDMRDYTATTIASSLGLV